MNIIEAEDMIKGLPDQVLYQYAQNPPPNVPQFLAVSEVQRRQDMRQRFQAQQAGQQQPTVKDQILQSGIGATGMAPEMTSAPPMAPPAPPAQMSGGGVVRMFDGRTVPSKDEIQRILSKPIYLRTPEEDAVLRSAGVPFQGARDLGSILRDSAQRRATPGFERYSPGPIPESGDFSYQNVTSSLNRGSLPAMELEAATPASQPAEVASAPPEVPAGGIADAGNAMAADAAATGTTGGQRAPSSGGMPDYLRDLMKPRERSPEVQAAIDMNRQLIEQGLPPPVDLGSYITAAEQREKDARGEARRMAIANALMSLGTGLVAGDTAGGMRQATQAVTETMAAGRKEAAAERAQAEALRLQSAQQQRQSILDTMKFRSESVNAIANIISGEEKADRSDMLQAAQIISNYQINKEKVLTEGATERGVSERSLRTARTAALQMAKDIFTANPTNTYGKSQEEISRSIMSIARTLDPSLFPAGETSGATGSAPVIVNHQGKQYSFPTKEAADNFKKQLGI